MSEFYEELSELIRIHSKLALVIVVRSKGSTPRELGAKMAILPDGTTHGTIGGGRLELLVTQDSQEALRNDESVLKDYLLEEEANGGIGAICGGEASVFIDIVTKGEKLLILGGGHIGLELYHMAPVAGFSVVIVDQRAEFAAHERFPRAMLLLNCQADDPRVKEVVDKDTYIVVVTHEHKQDKLAVKTLIDCKFKYLGMIGSKRKVKQTLTELEAEGIPKEKLEKVYAPIGLDIDAETPAEIAVSILAELIQVRRTGKASKISLKKNLSHYHDYD